MEMKMRQRLLVSIRGKKEALAAIKGGAHIADVEFPASALGTLYPLNIRAVKNAMLKNIKVATNIGEEQSGRSNACQTALGVSLAGADVVKLGLAKMPLAEAICPPSNPTIPTPCRFSVDLSQRRRNRVRYKITSY